MDKNYEQKEAKLMKALIDRCDLTIIRAIIKRHINRGFSGSIKIC